MDERVRELEAEVVRLRAERDAALARAACLEGSVAASPICMWCTSGETGRYLFVNEAFAALFGRTVEEALNADALQDWFICTHPDDRDLEHAAIMRLASGEIDRFQIEKRVVYPGGEVRWKRVDIVGVRSPSGRLDRIFGFFVDVQDRHEVAAAQRQLEGQLRQAQKLDALGKLAGGVAHDFNNRLLIIIGYTELLRRELPPGSPLAQQADMVLASAQRGAELTRQLLAYSRRQVLKPKAFDVSQTVDRLRHMLGRLLGERVELVTDLAGTSTVFADPGQIEQVILNLAINARDAMPSGGRLTLATAHVTLGAGQDPDLCAGEYVALAVRDTGTGIPDAVAARIFEPFFTTKEVGQGTGLGLAMVEGIVQQSGGAVRMATRVGEGTCFTVYLPRREAPPPPSYPVVDAPPMDISVQTVLVCDDDEDVRGLLVHVLRLRAHRVLQASSGRHALEVAREHGGPIHLLVTDLVMPEVGGIELAAALRERDPALRVLYVSGYSEDAAALSEPLGPHTRFLAKPFVPNELTSAIFSMLERT